MLRGQNLYTQIGMANSDRLVELQKLDMEMVMTTIKYAVETRRLAFQAPQDEEALVDREGGEEAAASRDRQGEDREEGKE